MVAWPAGEAREKFAFVWSRTGFYGELLITRYHKWGEFS
jgi:hypothetical protein